VSQINDIYIAEIFQHGRWKLSLNAQSDQLHREVECTERDRKDEKMGEKKNKGKTDGKIWHEEKIKRGAEKNITDNVT
jgi:hypothetical protein